MQQQTPSVRLAAILLGEDLGGWVAKRRDNGESWDAIAEALTTATNQQVTLTGEWLRRLYSPRAAGGAA